VNHTISQRSKWGKEANHVTIIRSLNPIKDRLSLHALNMSTQRQHTHWVWANHIRSGG